MKKYMMVLAIGLTVGCSNNGATLDTEHVTVYENTLQTEEEQPTIYTASSLEEALKAIPFEVQVPKELPNDFGAFSEVFITDWKDSNDGQDIGISMKTTQGEREEKQSIAIFASDFELVSFDHLIEGSQKGTLDDGRIAYYQPSNMDSDEFKSPSVYWKDKGIFYEISYSGYHEDQEDIRRWLLQMAEQMGG